MVSYDISRIILKIRPKMALIDPSPLNIFLFILQDAQINFEDGRFSVINIDFPKFPHSAIICSQTNCGKTVFVLDLLEKEYEGVFEHIVI